MSFDATKMLSEPQRRYLRQIMAAEKAGQPRQYNGRARTVIRALESMGLVTADWDMVGRTKGNGMQLVERITPRPTAMGSRVAEQMPL